MKKTSTAYIIGDKDDTLGLPEGQKWHFLRIGMGIFGQVEPEAPMPQFGVLPAFSVIATDRDAAKKLVCEKLDELFDVAEDEVPPNEYMYPTVRTWLDAMKQHTCDAKEMVSDDRLFLRLGYRCLGCGKWFGLRVTDMKTTIDAIGPASESLRLAMQTPEGRWELATSIGTP